MIAEIISTYPPLQNTTRIGKSARTQNFYSHASHEARLYGINGNSRIFTISTHTPLARRDLNREIYAQGTENFYSHASCEARLYCICNTIYIRSISTHTPLARRDLCPASAQSHLLYFYSHASCEARLIQADFSTYSSYFYSHASCEARLELTYGTNIPL